MIASPRSLARKPLAMGILIFGVLVGFGVIAYNAARSSADARTAELLAHEEARRVEAVRRGTEEWKARGGVEQRLCDDTQPNSVAEIAWFAYLHCLHERQREPRLQLAAVDRALAVQGSDQWSTRAEIQKKRGELLMELGDHAGAIRQLREAYESATGHRDDIAVELARAIIFGGSDDWDDRRAEAYEILKDVREPYCPATALMVISSYPDNDKLREHAGHYSFCVDRTSDGELETLMEIIAVSTTVWLVPNANRRVVQAHDEIARNFNIKSTFAICAEALPDAPGLRERCERAFED